MSGFWAVTARFTPTERASSLTTPTVPAISIPTAAGFGGLQSLGDRPVVADVRQHVDPQHVRQRALRFRHRDRGRIYALSSEHHVRNEMIFPNVSNWQIDACQMEEERAEARIACPSPFPIAATFPSPISISTASVHRVTVPQRHRA